MRFLRGKLSDHQIAARVFEGEGMAKSGRHQWAVLFALALLFLPTKTSLVCAQGLPQSPYSAPDTLRTGAAANLEVSLVRIRKDLGLSASPTYLTIEFKVYGEACEGILFGDDITHLRIAGDQPHAHGPTTVQILIMAASWNIP